SRGGACIMKDLRDIIKRPVITEHSADLMAEKKYTFEVEPKSKKPEIKQAVETAFGVKVDKDNTMNLKGKLKRMSQYGGYCSDRKKAIESKRRRGKTCPLKELKVLQTVQETCPVWTIVISLQITQKKRCFNRLTKTLGEITLEELLRVTKAEDTNVSIA